jgi:hypothetical protein
LVGNPAYYFGMGDLLREWNDLDAAEHHLEQGMDPVSEIPLLRSGAARRVQLEQLPVYAPDLNPDEGIYKHLKCGVEEPLLPEPFRVEGRTAQG